MFLLQVGEDLLLVALHLWDLPDMDFIMHFDDSCPPNVPVLSERKPPSSAATSVVSAVPLATSAHTQGQRRRHTLTRVPRAGWNICRDRAKGGFAFPSYTAWMYALGPDQLKVRLCLVDCEAKCSCADGPSRNAAAVHGHPAVRETCVPCCAQVYHQCLISRYPAETRRPVVYWRGSNTDPWIGSTTIENVDKVRPGVPSGEGVARARTSPPARRRRPAAPARRAQVTRITMHKRFLTDPVVDAKLSKLILCARLTAAGDAAQHPSMHDPRSLSLSTCVQSRCAVGAGDECVERYVKPLAPMAQLEDYNAAAIVMDVDGNGWSDRLSRVVHFPSATFKQVSRWRAGRRRHASRACGATRKQVTQHASLTGPPVCVARGWWCGDRAGQQPHGVL